MKKYKRIYVNEDFAKLLKKSAVDENLDVIEFTGKLAKFDDPLECFKKKRNSKYDFRF